ncbi:MAG TPA: hypothetical protein VHY32_02045, partial [Caulobacteraceae bacterium]|nr:hypothetical protein [Caulobacteraceae bacterium]
GYGIKAECSEAGFSIEQSLQWLPPPLAAGMISYPTGVNLRGDVASLNRNSITYLSRHPTTLRVGHDIDWHEIEAGDEWGDVEINIQRLTLSTSAEFIIAVRCEAGKGAMRFCLISDKGADAVEQSRELWIELMPGLQLLRFSLGEMRCQTGNLEISKAKRAYFGGPRSGLGKIHFALLDVNGCQVA